jgi:DNA-directed RNA polymerase specialized sigma24 family protein
VNKSAKQYAAEPVDPCELLVKWDSLAYKFTAGWSIPGFDRDDLVQEARMTIYRVAQSYDPKKGSFYAIARMSIGNRMKSLLAFTSAQKRTAEVIHLHSPVGDDGMLVEDIIPAEAPVDVVHLAEEKVRREIANIVCLPVKRQVPRIIALDSRVAEIESTLGVRIPPVRTFKGVSKTAAKLADALRIREVLKNNPLGLPISAMAKISGLTLYRARYLVQRGTDSTPKVLTNIERISYDHYRARSDEAPRFVNVWQVVFWELEKYPYGLTVARLHQLTGISKLNIHSALKQRLGRLFFHKEGLWYLNGQDISARLNLLIPEMVLPSDKILAAITRSADGVSVAEISQLTGIPPKRVSTWLCDHINDLPHLERCHTGFYRIKQHSPPPLRSITSRVLTFLSDQDGPVSVKYVADGINESIARVQTVLNTHGKLPNISRLPDGLFVHDPDKSVQPRHFQKVVDFLASIGRPVILSEACTALGLSHTSVSPLLRYGLLRSLFTHHGKFWCMASSKTCDPPVIDSIDSAH